MTEGKATGPGPAFPSGADTACFYHFLPLLLLASKLYKVDLSCEQFCFFSTTEEGELAYLVT